MRLILLLTITAFLIFLSRNAFSQAAPSYPNYSTAAVVPRAFAQSLMSRGYTPQQVLSTMNGFATVAANDNAIMSRTATSLGATVGMRTGTWLGAASRLPGLAGGAIGALQLGIAGYNYFTAGSGKAEANLGDGKPVVPITLKGTDFSFLASTSNISPTLRDNPEPQKTPSNNDAYFIGYHSYTFKCQGDTGVKCAIAEAKLALIKELQNRADQTFGNSHIALKQYLSACLRQGNAVVCQIRAVYETTATDGQTYQSQVDVQGVANPQYKYSASEPEANLSCTSSTDPLYQKWCKGNPDAVTLPSQILIPANTIPFYIPNQYKDQNIDPSTGAQILNDYWKRAASLSGYEGAPYPMNDPLNAADLANNPITLRNLAEPISPMQTANWPWAPNVNPWPQTNPNFPEGYAPVFQPGTSTNPSTGTDPATNPGTNPGGSTGGTTPPNVPEPTDPVSPTIEQILDPLFGMFDNLKTFQIPINDAKCPTPKFTVFQKEILIDSHCQILDELRSSIGNIFILFYTLIAFFIVFQA